MPNEGTKSQQKPPKLRSACNQCNAAKVKCTGERTGCTRCGTLRVDCVYVESRVGKVQGPRTKRKKSHVERSPEPSRQSSLEAQDRHSLRSSDSTEARNAPGLQLASLSRNAPDSLDDTLCAWSDEPWASENWGTEMASLENSVARFDQIFDDSSAALGNDSGFGATLSVTASTDGNSASGSSLVFSSELSSNTSVTTYESTCPPHVATPPPPTLPTPVSPVLARPPARHPSLRNREPTAAETEKRIAKVNSKCVMACIGIVSTLENYLLSELTVLDLILSTVRSVTTELKSLVHYQQEARSDRCAFLFLTIMCQIVTLLETGTKPLFEDDDDNEHPDDDGLDVPVRSSFKIGFGSFSVGKEQERSWKMHIIRKELQGVSEILNMMITLAKLGPREGAPAATVEEEEERTKCLRHLENKLKNVLHRAGAASNGEDVLM